MNKQELLTLFDYNYWANGRILQAAAQVAPADFVAPRSFSHGGLRGILVHALSAEWVWRTRFQEKVYPATLLAETDFPAFADLQARWQQEERAMRDYVNGLTDEQINGSMFYRTLNGAPYEHPLWQLLLHVVNHGTQHRGEAAALLTELGHSPGDIDLIIYMREKV